MNTPYCLGIDVAKRNIQFRLVDADRQQRIRGTTPATRAGFDQLRQTLAAVAPPAEILVVLEATGLLHVPWAEAFTAAGFPVLVLNPLVAKRLCDAGHALRDNKTDQLDADKATLAAQQPATQLAPFRYQSDPRRLALQRLLSVRADLRQQLTNLRKSYAALLQLVFPELSSLLNIHDRRVRRGLAQAASPAALAALRPAKLQAAFGKKAAAVRAAARSSLASEPISAGCGPALQAQLATIAQLEEQIAALDQTIHAHTTQGAHPERIELVRSIPGYGARTAPVVLAYVPAVFWAQRWGQRRLERKLLAFMGAEPRVRDSGQTKGQRRMSKRGCQPLRTATFQASLCGRLHDAELDAVYRRHYEQKNKPHKVAISHVMRRQVQRLARVLRTGRAYPKPAPRHPSRKNNANRT